MTFQAAPSSFSYTYAWHCGLACVSVTLSPCQHFNDAMMHLFHFQIIFCLAPPAYIQSFPGYVSAHMQY